MWPSTISGSAASACLTVVFFGPIGRQIVKLRTWCLDELETPILNRAQLAPAVVISGVPAFRMRDQAEVLATREWHQVRALHLPRHRDPEQRQRRRHDVYDSHLVRDDRRRHAGAAHDERDVRRSFVDEEHM